MQHLDLTTGVVPEGLVRDLDRMVTWEPADSPRAAAMKQAADVLRNLPTLQSDAKRLENQTLQAKSYRADIDEDNKEARLVFFGDHGSKRVLGFMLMTTAETYELAQYLLKQYDSMEGIK
jgi:hypothetical protein